MEEKRPVPKKIETRSFHEEAVKHDRTETPVVGRDTSHEAGNEQSMLNEVDIDFRGSGLPHSVVKQAQNSRVRELFKKIENHPHRHALQRDLQQNEAYHPFSTTTKQMIHDVGNVEFFLNCSRRTVRRSAQNAYHTGVKASSIAHARASLERNSGQSKCQ